MYVSAVSVIKDDSGVNRGGVLLIAFVWGGVLIHPLKNEESCIFKKRITNEPPEFGHIGKTKRV